MGSVGCTEDLGFCPEGSGEARRVFLIIVANYYLLSGGGDHSYVLSWPGWTPSG